MDSSLLEDSESDIFASPSKPSRSKHNQTTTTAASSPPQSPQSQSSQNDDRPKTPSTTAAPGPLPTRFDAEEARQTALKRELEGVRNINLVIENVIATLDRAKDNMGTVSQTVTNASNLLNTWTRILSQTEHNQRLILNPNWNGATADLAEIEAEAAARQVAARRRAEEEERRREEVRRRAEEEEMRRAAAAATPAPRGGTRGRGRGRALSSGYGRGGYSSGYGQSSGYGRQDDTGSSVGSGRGDSGIGRGVGSSRAGRGRGTR